ncbi:hypothetical protein [Pseudonocardia sp. MH-G8]|uniref:hypothetical protein n=1 Tax=Pseudonocardia sp. MH-G8 TaxID=1854588 RepID=UPI000BA0D9F0|nr:hypothetical protein [Pseudonocardia sp. MH-G8]OZM81144.1 hypothetical protein CFP66_17340 [Pseudonocardia sp. MH-G8]
MSAHAARWRTHRLLTTRGRLTAFACPLCAALVVDAEQHRTGHLAAFAADDRLVEMFTAWRDEARADTTTQEEMI